MATKKQLTAILKDLDIEISSLKDKCEELLKKQIATTDFSDKNYFSSIRSGYETSILLLERSKEIVKKHLKG
jgi:hypothetical protein